MKRIIILTALLLLTITSCTHGQSPPNIGETNLSVTIDSNSHITEINEVRTRWNLPPLSLDLYLERGAQRQAVYCARNGRLVHAGGVTEILAQNHQGFQSAINQWLNSQPHKNILLSRSYRYAGVGVVRDSNGRVWCAVQFR